MSDQEVKWCWMSMSNPNEREVCLREECEAWRPETRRQVEMNVTEVNGGYCMALPDGIGKR